MEAPKLLCRYRQFNDNNLDALEKGRLYFSIPYYFNDPFDSFAYINEDKYFASIAHEWDVGFGQGEYFKNVLKIDPNSDMAKLIKEQVDNQDIRKQHLQRIKEEIKAVQKQVISNTKVICFSESFLSTLMWSHYAGEHTGFALLFDFNELKSAKVYDADGKTLPLEAWLDRVVYQTKAPDYGQDFFEEMPNRLSYRPPFLPNNKSTTFHTKYLYNKQADWSYEKEWRLCAVGEDVSEKSRAQYIKVNPYAVLLGARMKHQDRVRIHRILEKNIFVYEVFADDSTPHYSLSRRRVFSV